MQACFSIFVDDGWLVTFSGFNGRALQSLGVAWGQSSSHALSVCLNCWGSTDGDEGSEDSEYDGEFHCVWDLEVRREGIWRGLGGVEKIVGKQTT